MLAEYFASHLRIQEIRGCPEGHLLEEFSEELYRAGYAQLTARRHLRAAEHLVQWAGGKGMPASALEERFIKDFSQHLSLCRCIGYPRQLCIGSIFRGSLCFIFASRVACGSRNWLDFISTI